MSRSLAVGQSIRIWKLRSYIAKKEEMGGKKENLNWNNKECWSWLNPWTEPSNGHSKNIYIEKDTDTDGRMSVKT